MKARSLLVMALLLVLPVNSEARGSRLDAGQPVTVRVYQSAGDTSRVFAARRHVDRLFRAAGIAVTWVECRFEREACRQRLGPAELMLRLSAATDASATSNERSLGFAFVDPESRVSRLATVYPERVAALARLARVDETELLARAVAHELGHLLIQSRQHAQSGLMRALWTMEELRGDRQLDWSFSATEIVVMHNALAVLVRNDPRRQLESERDDNMATRLARRDPDAVALAR